MASSVSHRSIDDPASPAPESPAAPGAHRRAVVVHAGARDAYQLALALSEAGLLEALVTDLFWPGGRTWTEDLLARLAPGVLATLKRRGEPRLPATRVSTSILQGLSCLAFERLPAISSDRRRQRIRGMDQALGRKAGTLAKRKHAGLISYSYTGFDAIREYGAPAMLFQVHPHPISVRRLLTEELQAHPDCASSLQQEWELALPEQDFQHLVEETAMASQYLVASSFTRATMVEQGLPLGAITVVPYGVDLKRFHPPPQPEAKSKTLPLRLLFVGRINQRKGVKYLLNALQLLSSEQIHLTICGRVVDDLSLFRPFAGQIEIRPSVSAEELVAAYQAADLFVFPSVAEGFGQVLLESLASGLPILSTTHTAAPDLIDDGVQGFVIEPRKPELLAERIEWAATHRDQIAQMAIEARRRAELFTWEKFRSGAANAARQYLIRPQ